MSAPKRTYEDVDPDYTDVCEQQNKRQRAIEQDAKQSVCKRIQAIVRNEFQKEINNKEMELHQVDKRLNEARLMMDRLRACIVSTYYRQMNQCGASEMSSMSGSSASIHPAVKKCLGKRPLHYDTTSDSSTPHTQTSSGIEASSSSDCKYSVHQNIQSIARQDSNTSRVTTASQPTSAASSSSSALAKAPAVLSVDASYDDRRARFKIKKKIIIGNVSKYIPIDHREANDKSSHKWMIYVRGPRTEPDISGFVKKVWFFLHHSYKPNDLVEISSPPFHLTRRGWGEFPVRVQLHFVDPRNKKVDIIHQLKLDKTFSGLQTLGAETTVEVDLEKDFFEADGNSSNLMRQSSSSSSLYQQAEPSFSSSFMAAAVPAERLLPASHKGNSVLLEQSSKNLHDDPEADDSGMDCESVMDNKYAPSQCLGSMNETMEGCVADLATGLEPLCEVKTETASPENCGELSREYNVTIAHDTNESDPHEQDEEIDVTDLATAVKLTQETVAASSAADSPGASGLQTTTSTSCAKIKQEHLSAKSSIETPLTIIKRPQWVTSADISVQSLPVTLSSFGIDQIIPVTVQRSSSGISQKLASASVNTVNQSLVVDRAPESLSLGSVDHNRTVTPVSSQSNSYIFAEPSGLSVKPVIKQLCPSISALPPSLSVLPVLNSAKIIVPTDIGSAKLPSSQHISASAASSGPKSAVRQSLISLSQLTHQLPKFPQPSQQSSDGQKFIIIKPNLPVVKPQIAVPSTAASGGKSLLPPKPTGPKQVSLLTGRVFTPPTPPPVASKVFTPSQRTKESLLAKHSLVTKDTFNKILALQNLPNQLAKSGSKQGQVLVLKTVNHPTLAVSQTTDHGANQLHNSANIKLVNGLLGQDMNSHKINVSLITPDGLTKKPESPLTVLNSCIPIKNVTCQMLQHRQTQIIGSDRVLQVPGQSQTQLTNGHSVSSFPKMSAIGITKHGKNSSIMPVVNTKLRSTTDEERKQNQYAVLMAWKKNQHLQEKPKAVVKVAKDTIEGEADIIPELNLDDHSSLRTLLKAAVKLHPLVQTGVNKLTHPYCAESLEQWNAWTVGKQLGSEWHRACFVLKYLKTLLGTSSFFKGESLMSTRQLVRWCRHHAYSPVITVLKVKAEKLSDSVPEDSTSFMNHTHVSSFTASSTLENGLLAKAAVQALDDDGKQEIDVVAAGDKDKDKTETRPHRIQECSDVSKNQEWLQPSDGAVFVYDELRKRGIKLQPVQLEHDVLAHTTADMLYMAMQEFVGDILREAAAVSSSQSSHSFAVEVTRRDVHKALTQLPEAAFACNQYLGKGDDVNDGSER